MKKPHEALEKALYRAAGSDAILPDSYELATEEYSENAQIYYNSQYHYGFKCYLSVQSSQWYDYPSIMQTLFICNGFDVVDYFTYQKGKTFIQISDVFSGYGGYYIQYSAWLED